MPTCAPRASRRSRREVALCRAEEGLLGERSPLARKRANNNGRTYQMASIAARHFRKLVNLSPFPGEIIGNRQIHAVPIAAPRPPISMLNGPHQQNPGGIKPHTTLRWGVRGRPKARGRKWEQDARIGAAKSKARPKACRDDFGTRDVAEAEAHAYVSR